MANYKQIITKQEDGKSEVTTITLLLSDSYTMLIDEGTVFEEITCLNIQSPMEKIQGKSLNVITESMKISFRSSEIYNVHQTANEAVRDEIFDVQTNNTNFYARLMFDDYIIFTGKINNASFDISSIVLEQNNYLTDIIKKDFTFEILEAGSNIFQEILTTDILTDDLYDRLVASNVIETKQGAYKDVSIDRTMRTQQLIRFDELVEAILIDLISYINTNFDIPLIGYIYNGDATIGVGCPYAVNLTKFDYNGTEYFTPQPFTVDFETKKPVGTINTYKFLWGNTEGLYLANSNEKNNFWLSAIQFFDTDETDVFANYKDDQASPYRYCKNSEFIFDLFDRIADELKVTFQLRIEDDILILNFFNIDSKDKSEQVYTDKVEDIQIKKRTPEEDEEGEIGADYIGLTNAYACEKGEIYYESDPTKEIKSIPLGVTLGSSYIIQNGSLHGAMVGHNYIVISSGNIFMTSTICPHTTIYMKVDGYLNDGDGTGMEAVRPNNFWTPVGRLGYKLNTDDSKTFKSMEQRANYFDRRYSGEIVGAEPYDITVKIHGLSNFSNNTFGTGAKADNLRVNKYLNVGGYNILVTEITRDIDGVLTTVKGIADDFFGTSTPTIDDSGQNPEFGSIVEIGGGGSGGSGTGASGVTIALMDLLAYDLTGFITVAENLKTYYGRVFGFAISKTTSSSGAEIITYQKTGYLTRSEWSWTANKVVYAYNNGVGIVLTQTEYDKNADNEMLLIIGTAVSSDTININIRNYNFE